MNAPTSIDIEPFVALRRELHRQPELGTQTFRTAERVMAVLREMGIDDIHYGMAESAVVARLKKGTSGRKIGLRADMDALPIREASGVAYASEVDGAMHACGHDGHTASLLAAAKMLVDTPFDGEVVLIFQPAEEVGGGANLMLQDGFLAKFPLDEIYAFHNLPGLEEGVFATCEGPIMASTDTLEIMLEGRGGHAAFPEETIDPIPVALRLIDSIYAIKTRMVAAQDPAVISITQIHTGSAENIVPQSVYINGTIRTLSAGARQRICSEIEKLGNTLPPVFGVASSVRIFDSYPVTVNSPPQTQYAIEAAKRLGATVLERPAEMGAEDFSFFLEKIPGAYVFIGAGDGAALHHPEYDFNDRVLPVAAAWFRQLIQDRLAV